MQSTQIASQPVTAPLEETFEDDFTRRAVLTARRMLEAQDQYKVNELARLLKIKELNQSVK